MLRLRKYPLGHSILYFFPRSISGIFCGASHINETVKKIKNAN